jgi:hypothetical protein
LDQEINKNQLFINYEGLENEETPFKILLSSKNNCNLYNMEYICIDSTYKLNNLDFPLVVVGIIDFSGVFNLIGIAICKYEKCNDFIWIFECLKKKFEYQLQPKYIMADASPAISAAVEVCFPGATRQSVGFMLS